MIPGLTPAGYYLSPLRGWLRLTLRRVIGHEVRAKNRVATAPGTDSVTADPVATPTRRGTDSITIGYFYFGTGILPIALSPMLPK